MITNITPHEVARGFLSPMCVSQMPAQIGQLSRMCRPARCLQLGWSFGGAPGSHACFLDLRPLFGSLRVIHVSAATRSSPVRARPVARRLRCVKQRGILTRPGPACRKRKTCCTLRRLEGAAYALAPGMSSNRYADALTPAFPCRAGRSAPPVVTVLSVQAND